MIQKPFLTSRHISLADKLNSPLTGEKPLANAPSTGASCDGFGFHHILEPLTLLWVICTPFNRVFHLNLAVTISASKPAIERIPHLFTPEEVTTLRLIFVAAETKVWEKIYNRCPRHTSGWIIPTWHNIAMDILCLCMSYSRFTKKTLQRWLAPQVGLSSKDLYYLWSKLCLITMASRRKMWTPQNRVLQPAEVPFWIWL